MSKRPMMATRSGARKRRPNEVANTNPIDVGAGRDDELSSNVMKSTEKYVVPMWQKLQSIDWSSFESLREIHFCEQILTPTSVKCIKDILPKIETIILDHVQYYGDFYSGFLKHCSNLKCLQVLASEVDQTVYGIGNDWLVHKYPKLEQFKFHLVECCSPIDEMAEFFKQNPDIKNLSMDVDTLCSNESTILTANLQLEHFETEYEGLKHELSFEPYPFLDLLKKLHQKNFYKRLSLTYTSTDYKDNEIMNLIVALPALKTFGINLEPFDDIDYTIFNKLNNLKQLKLCGDYHIHPSLIDIIAKGLVNLECISFESGTSDEIFSFLCYTPKLNKMNVPQLSKKQESNNIGLLDLPEWSKKREKLRGASKLTIYVNEKVYSITESTLKETNFEFVEIKSIQSKNQLSA